MPGLLIHVSLIKLGLLGYKIACFFYGVALIFTSCVSLMLTSSNTHNYILLLYPYYHQVPYFLVDNILGQSLMGKFDINFHYLYFFYISFRKELFSFLFQPIRLMYSHLWLF